MAGAIAIATAGVFLTTTTTTNYKPLNSYHLHDLICGPQLHHPVNSHEAQEPHPLAAPAGSLLAGGSHLRMQASTEVRKIQPSLRVKSISGQSVPLGFDAQMPPIDAKRLFH